MKYIIATLIVLFGFTAVNAQQEYFNEEYSYGKFGIGFPDLINGGFGYRHFQGSHGYDFSLSAGTCVLVTDVNLKGLYLYRFSPYSPSSFYTGAGLGVNYLYAADWTSTIQAVMVTPEVVLGRSWTLQSGRKNFLQLSGSLLHDRHSAFPSLRLEYGISF